MKKDTYEIIKGAHSISSLRCAEECPLRYRKRYIQGLDETSGELAIIGTAVHKALAWYYRAWMEDGSRLMQETLWRKAITVENEDGTEGQLEDADGRHGKIFDIIERFLSDGQLNELPRRDEVVRSWIEGQIILNKDGKWDHSSKGGRWAHGTPDFAYLTKAGKLVVIDSKSGWKKHDDPEQVRWYAYLCSAMAKTKIKEIEVRYHMVAFGKATSMTFGPEELPKIWEEFKSRALAIEAMTEFPAIQGDWCKWCGFHAECPEMQLATMAMVPAGMGEIEVKDPFSVVTVEDARKAILFLNSGAQVMKSVREAVKAFVMGHGAIEINGLSARMATGKKIESMSFEEILKDAQKRIMETGKPREEARAMIYAALDGTVEKTTLEGFLKAIKEPGKKRGGFIKPPEREAIIADHVVMGPGSTRLVIGKAGAGNDEDVIDI